MTEAIICFTRVYFTPVQTPMNALIMSDYFNYDFRLAYHPFFLLHASKHKRAIELRSSRCGTSCIVVAHVNPFLTPPDEWREGAGGASSLCCGGAGRDIRGIRDAIRRKRGLTHME